MNLLQQELPLALVQEFQHLDLLQVKWLLVDNQLKMPLKHWHHTQTLPQNCNA
jgi:hypothetical protein